LTLAAGLVCVGSVTGRALVADSADAGSGDTMTGTLGTKDDAVTTMLALLGAGEVAVAGRVASHAPPPMATTPRAAATAPKTRTRLGVPTDATLEEALVEGSVTRRIVCEASPASPATG